MSRRIFRDTEEAISREIRRITFDDTRTADLVVLRDVFDVFTGELVQTPIEPSFYDSSADTNNIQYPHFFVRLLTTKEDRFTGRVIPEYGKEILEPIPTAPKAYELVIAGSDGTIASPGNIFHTTAFQIRKVVPGYYLRLTTGNNVGTYLVDTVTPSNTGTHAITVKNTLLASLPATYFRSDTRQLYFAVPVDLNTVKVGDVFTDVGSVSYNITNVDVGHNFIELDGTATPNLTAGATVSRVGNVFQNPETGLVCFSILNPNTPVSRTYGSGDAEATTGTVGVSPSIPIDSYYLVRIDSKERETHIDIINRMWEEFNPPRTALPTIVRSASSAEQLLTADVTTGGSPTITVADVSNFNVNDSVFVLDDFHPTKSVDGGFEQPFKSTIVAINPVTNELTLADVVPDTFLAKNHTKIVSNADFYLFMFHFVDHKTKDVEGSQYWVHEFTFWVQFWIDRQGTVVTYDSVVQKIDSSIVDANDNTVIFP